ncbi:hypothetical protein Tco_0408929, partial [Tanacetum coccineum]
RVTEGPESLLVSRDLDFLLGKDERYAINERDNESMTVMEDVLRLPEGFSITKASNSVITMTIQGLFNLTKAIGDSFGIWQIESPCEGCEVKEKRGQRGNGPQKDKAINMVRCQGEDQNRKSMLVDEDWMNKSSHEIHNHPGSFTLQHHPGPPRLKEALSDPIHHSSNDGVSNPLGNRYLAYPDQLVMIGGNLSLKGSTQLKTLLKRNQDIFAWEPLDMTGMLKRIIKHSLNGNLTVTSVDGSWRMCIDFKNINSACPKDYYPEIDLKIESIMGFRFKYFLDSYKGYHQVQMAEEDEKKWPSIRIRVSDIHKRTKIKAKWTKPSTRLEEREKSKPRAYSSLMGKPVSYWLTNVEAIGGLRMDDLEFVMIEGSRFKLKDTHLPLDPSSPAIKGGSVTQATMEFF